MFKIIMKVGFTKPQMILNINSFWGEVNNDRFYYYYIISILPQSSIISMICPDTASA